MAQKYQSKPLNKQKACRPWEPDLPTALWTSLPSTALALSFHQRHRAVYTTSPFASPFCLWSRCAGSTSLVVAPPETFPATEGMDSCVQKLGVLPGVVEFGLPRSRQICLQLSGLHSRHCEHPNSLPSPLFSTARGNHFLPGLARPCALPDQCCDSRAPFPARPVSLYQSHRAFGVLEAASFPVCNFRFNCITSNPLMLTMRNVETSQPCACAELVTDSEVPLQKSKSLDEIGNPPTSEPC